jgi:hypothetical protein
VDPRTDESRIDRRSCTMLNRTSSPDSTLPLQASSSPLDPVAYDPEVDRPVNL